MNLITDLINKRTQELIQEKKDKNKKQQSELDKKAEELKPMLSILEEGLAPFGLKPSLHTDKKHYPCPAIHIKKGNNNWNLRRQISEIYMTSEKDKKWKSGECNGHNYSFKSDEDLINFVVEKVSEARAR